MRHWLRNDRDMRYRLLLNSTCDKGKLTILVPETCYIGIFQKIDMRRRILPPINTPSYSSLRKVKIVTSFLL